jgi:hypothetical protein
MIVVRIRGRNVDTPSHNHPFFLFLLNFVV